MFHVENEMPTIQTRQCIVSIFCALVCLSNFGTGCAPDSPAELSRERLRKINVLFETASGGNQYANIPGTEAGCLIVKVPHFRGGKVDHSWTDTDFKEAVGDLRNLDDLDYLLLRLTRITDRAMSDVASLTQLRHLNLSMTTVTDDGISKLAPLRTLCGLYLDGARQITGVGMKSLNAETLQKLSLRGTAASDETMGVLKDLVTLEHLDLGGTAIGDKTVSIVATLPKLKTLLLDRTAITDAGVRDLRQAKNLERLVICMNSQIKGDDLREICRLPRLAVLDISGTGVTKESVFTLRGEFSHLQIDWFPEIK